MSKHFIVIFVSCSIAVFKASALGQEIHFGLPDYAELGGIDGAIREAYEELGKAGRSLGANTSYAAYFANGMGAMADAMNVPGYSANILNFGSTLRTIQGLTQANDIQQIAGTLGSLNLSPIEHSLGELRTRIAELNAQSVENISVPTGDIFRAAAASCRARAEVEQLKSQCSAAQESLLRAANNIATLIPSLTQYSERLFEVERLCHQLAEQIGGSGLGGLLSWFVVDLLGNESSISSLRGGALASTLSELYTAQSRVAVPLISLGELINALDSALYAPVLGSNWTSSADTGQPNAYYGLTFVGRSWSEPCTEINGAFDLGTLRLTNFVTPQGGGNSLSATVLFTVVRIVNDPDRGAVETTATVSFPMSYHATPNTEDPVASRDYFTINGLGVNIRIFENATTSIRIRARYNSPLRIVAVVPEVDTDPELIEPFAYLLDVVGGSGGGVYEAGTLVPISVEVDDNRTFVAWEGDVAAIADPTSPSTTVMISDSNVSVAAKSIPRVTKRTLVVENGAGSGEYEEGSLVFVSAAPPPQKSFTRWEGDIEALVDPSAAVSQIRMSRDLVIRPVFDETDDCPNDPAKLHPGTCGCDVPDTDSDGDGLSDCIDYCITISASPVLVGDCGNTPPVRSIRGCTLEDELGSLIGATGDFSGFRSEFDGRSAQWVSAGIADDSTLTALKPCAESAFLSVHPVGPLDLSPANAVCGTCGSMGISAGSAMMASMFAMRRYRQRRSDRP